MPTNITMIDGKNVIVDFADSVEGSRDEAFEIIKRYCGDEFTLWCKEALTVHIDKPADYDDYEMIADEYAEALREVMNVVEDYKTKVFDKKSKIMRKDIESFIKALKYTVNEVI